MFCPCSRQEHATTFFGGGGYQSRDLEVRFVSISGTIASVAGEKKLVGPLSSRSKKRVEPFVRHRTLERRRSKGRRLKCLANGRSGRSSCNARTRIVAFVDERAHKFLHRSVLWECITPEDFFSFPQNRVQFRSIELNWPGVTLPEFSCCLVFSGLVWR